MTATMPAYRIVEWGRQPELVEVPVPEPGPSQVRVRVAGCGLCHSDLTMSAMSASLGEKLGWQMPFTLGHEIAGWVDAVGSGVVNHREGAAVAVAAPTSCGACRWCRQGMENACPEGGAGRGYGRDGGLATYVLVDDAERVAIDLGDPDRGGFDPSVAGPLTDAGATARHAVRRVLQRVQPDAAVVVLGLGGLGAFAVQLAVVLGDVPVVGVDPDARRRELALDLGAVAAVDGVGDATATDIRAVLGGSPVDGVVDLVGTDDTIALSASILAPGGSLAVVGAGGGTLRRPWFGSLPADADIFSFQGSDLSDLRAVVDLASAGRIRVDVEPFALDRVAEAYRSLEAGTLLGRAVVAPPPG